MCLPSGILQKVREGAETVHGKIQAKAESVLKHGAEYTKGELFYFQPFYSAFFYVVLYMYSYFLKIKSNYLQVFQQSTS